MRPWVRRALGALLVVLVAPALLLTLVRLVEPGLGVALQLQAFTPFALPLYAAALLPLLVVVVVRWVRCRRPPVGPAVAAVAVLAGLGLHAWWFAPLLTGDRPEAAPGADPVVVMSANALRGEADADQLVRQVVEHDVDVLAVSEITTTMVDDLAAAGLGDVLPQAHGEPGPAGSIEGTMVFTREQSSVLTLDLDTRLGGVVVDGGGVSVVAVHPVPPLDPDDWRADHAAVRDVVESVRPDVVVGDLNATLDHEPVRDLLDLGYRDAVELTGGGFAPTWPNDGGYGLFGVVGRLGPVAQIDHVLVRDGWTVLEVDDLGLDDTDHRSVVATVAPAA